MRPSVYEIEKKTEMYETMRDTRQVMNITDGRNLY